MSGWRFALSLTWCSVTVLAQVTFDPYSKVAPQHTAAEILERAIHALENVKSMEYDVRMIPAPNAPKDVLYAGKTTVIGTPGAPIQYRARFVAEEPPTVVLAVSNGDKLRVSDRGALSENLTRVMEEEASTAALPTLQMFDVKRFRKWREANNALYAGQDDIEGDLCYVIAVSIPFAEDIGSDTTYFWISAKTGLPRSRQTFRVMHGRTMTTTRWVVSNTRLNVDVPPETFKYHPIEADSIAAAPAVTIAAPQPPARVGDAVAGLELRDPDYNPVSLKKAVEGKATIVTLWAPWCGPCVGEMPVFEKMVERYSGKLQVVALGVNDSRLSFFDYAKKHPELHFTYLTDPNLEDLESKVQKYFSGIGIPRNLYVAPDGKIIDYANGFDGKEEVLIKRIENLMAGKPANPN